MVNSFSPGTFCIRNNDLLLLYIHGFVFKFSIDYLCLYHESGAASAVPLSGWPTLLYHVYLFEIKQLLIF